MDKSNKSLSEVHESVDLTHSKSRFRTLMAFIGPAYLVSVGYMDPGNWATDIAGGSRFGYTLIWVLLMSNWVAILLQSLAAKLGIVKGWDLAQASRQQYPAWINVPLYILAEIAIAATDLAEIIGMAIGLNLLFDLPLMYGVLITVLDTFLLLFLINKGIRKIELFIFSLVSIIGLSFLMEMFIVEPEVNKLVDGFIPSALSGEALYIAIGIIGATIMPHNLYLHSSLVQTRKIKRDEKGIKQALKFNFFDSAIALNAAFFVNAAILILAAAAFHKNGFNQVADITDAHQLLKGIFGDLAPTLFAVALIAAGQSSTITGTLAGQIVMEGYLNLRISPWIRRLITRLIAVAPAVFTIAYFGEEKIGDLLIFSQVILSLQLGFAVIPLIHFTSSKKLMGHFVNKKWVVVLAWISALIIIGLNVKLVGEELSNFLVSDYAQLHWLKLIVFIVVLYIAFLLVFVSVSPFLNKMRDKRMIPHTPIKPLALTRADAYQRIGIAVDFSSMDEASIQHALSAGNKEAHYFLFHIVESAAAMRHGENVMDIETKQDFAWITAYTNDLRLAGYTVSFEMEYGNRAANIAALAIRNNIELLVMGAHGHAGLKDILFGSTVEAVRHKLNIPILVVR
ncbi:MAG: Nramp family divalent metal transporter [Sphingobacteriales bacterium]|jgi:manganese transport protein|nr:Nramp family divalent metal transporter [Sphingobacteriales bacterium]